METPETLAELMRERLNGRPLVVVSNREPYAHHYREGRIVCDQPASGVAVALDAVMRAAGGVWVAAASGAADRAATGPDGCVEVPPNRPRYKLKRVWLSKRQEQLYYCGFANSAVWPLCHVAYRKPVFRREQWEAYRQVNELFADRIAEEVGSTSTFVFIQDYHFALLPALLRARCPHAMVAHFWHIPWPDPDVFDICPWKKEILEGMLGNDLLGFHLRRDCQNFMATVERELEARTDRHGDAVVHAGWLAHLVCHRRLRSKRPGRPGGGLPAFWPGYRARAAARLLLAVRFGNRLRSQRPARETRPALAADDARGDRPGAVQVPGERKGGLTYGKVLPESALRE